MGGGVGWGGGQSTVYIGKQGLVIAELMTDFIVGVPAEIITQGYKQITGFKQLGFLPVLVKQDGAPISHIAVIDRLRCSAPRTRVATTQAREIKLTTDSWFWSARVRNIVGIEWHHVAENVVALPFVPGLVPSR